MGLGDGSVSNENKSKSPYSVADIMTGAIHLSRSFTIFSLLFIVITMSVVSIKKLRVNFILENMYEL